MTKPKKRIRDSALLRQPESNFISYKLKYYDIILFSRGYSLADAKADLTLRLLGLRKTPDPREFATVFTKIEEVK